MLAATIADALRLYSAAEEKDSILRMISRHGFPLVERGQAEVVAAAINAVPEEQRNATALGISAVLAANGGDIEAAERLFSCAQSSPQTIATFASN